jgi:predicted  nucleic acid-binding Zn-ribbon protein
MSLSYIYIMDERKKAIAGLEAKKQEALASLNLIFENFGESLFARIYGQGESPVEHAVLAPPGAQEYLKLKKDIADSEQLIRVTESDTLRLKELEAYIHGKEEECAALSREAAETRVELGRRMHGDPAFAGITGSCQDRLDNLADKIRVNELKLDQMDGQDGSNVFFWVGKNAQTLSLRFFLGRDQANLEKAYESLGARLLRGENAGLVSGHEIAGLAEEAEELEKKAETLKTELVRLRSERGKLSSTFAVEGGALKRIQSLERHIAYVKGELKTVYRRFGEEAADPAGVAGFAHLFNDDDKPALEKSELARKTIGEYDREIEKLKAAIAIDDEKAGIEKMRRSIQDHQDRIKAGEEAIADLEARIAGAEKHITELERLL